MYIDSFRSAFGCEFRPNGASRSKTLKKSFMLLYLKPIYGRAWGSLFKNETSTARPKGHHFGTERHIGMRVSLRVTIFMSHSI